MFALVEACRAAAVLHMWQIANCKFLNMNVHSWLDACTVFTDYSNYAMFSFASSYLTIDHGKPSKGSTTLANIFPLPLLIHSLQTTTFRSLMKAPVASITVLWISFLDHISGPMISSRILINFKICSASTGRNLWSSIAVPKQTSNSIMPRLGMLSWKG